MIDYWFVETLIAWLLIDIWLIYYDSTGFRIQFQMQELLEVPPTSVSIWFQLPQYIIITVGEVLFAITGLAFTYSQVRPQSKSSEPSNSLLIWAANTNFHIVFFFIFLFWIVFVSHFRIVFVSHFPLFLFPISHFMLFLFPLSHFTLFMFPIYVLNIALFLIFNLFILHCFSNL